MPKIIISLIGIILLSGCSVFNPYRSSFQCPLTNEGKCTSVSNAYKESVGGVIVQNGPPGQKEKEKTKESVKKKDSEGTADNKNLYEEALYGKLAGLIKEPVTPMVAPAQVMRILLFPYKGEGKELYMNRFIYFFVDEPTFVLGNVKEGSGE